MVFVNNNHINLLSTQEALPLIPALTSGRYHIKWTQLADLPAPLYGAFVAVQHHKIYVAGGDSPDDDAMDQVYVYDINNDQWGQLPPSGHYSGVPRIIGGKLVILGGCISANSEETNKVSTFGEDSQTWTSYYPDLLSVRNRPGVVSHLEHVIVAGGIRPSSEDDDTPVVQDDIEVLNWIENSHWRKVSIKLPVPMYVFTPTITSDDHLLIVSYAGADMRYHKNAYTIPFANITAPNDQHYTPTKWSELTVLDHDSVAPIPSSSLPLVVGGEDSTGRTVIADIKMYDNSNKSWKKIGSLSSARTRVAVAAVYNNAIIIIGGCTTVETVAKADSSSMTIVELGQAELLH